MADEDAIGQEIEQASPEEPQVDDAVLDEGEPVVAEVVPDVEVSSDLEAVIESTSEAVESLPDLSSLTPSKLREIAPDLAKAIENAGAQSREAQLRREAGSREQTRQRVAQIKARLAEIPDGDAAGLDFLYDNAEANAGYNFFRSQAEQALQIFDPDPDTRAAIEAQIENIDPAKMPAYTAQIVQLAANKIGKQTAYDGGIDDIPKGSRLDKEIQADRATWRANELKAMRLELQQKKDAPPNVSEGRAPGGVGGGPTAEEYRNASRQQRAAWRKQGVEIQLEA